MRTTFWNSLPSSASACRSIANKSSKSYKGRRGHQIWITPGGRSRRLEDANHNLFSILYVTTSGPAFSVVRRFEGKPRENKVGHGQDAWAALREKFDGCSREALRAAHREVETVKMRPEKYPDNILYKEDGCRDRLNYVTPEEGPSNRQYEDIIYQCLPPEYGRIRPAHF